MNEFTGMTESEILEILGENGLQPTDEELIAAQRLNRDLKKAATLFTTDQARYFVKLYYTLQKLRIGAAAQARSAGEEPNSLVLWTKDMYANLENDVKAALEVYAKSQVPGAWALSIKGIGPVLAAGLLAYVDVEKGRTAGALWRYAGYNPEDKWLGAEGAKKLVNEALGPGRAKDVVTDEQLVEIALRVHRKADNLYAKAADEDGDVTRASLIKFLSIRPWNPYLKVIGWKCWQSFLKSSGNEGSFYGPLLIERRLLYMQRNAEGEYVKRAEQILREKNIGEDTEAYKAYAEGKLPKAHILNMSGRWVAKMFLSHYHTVAYYNHYKEPAPTPYTIEHKGHVDIIYVPNWPFGDAPQFRPIAH